MLRRLLKIGQDLAGLFDEFRMIDQRQYAGIVHQLQQQLIVDRALLFHPLLHRLIAEHFFNRCSERGVVSKLLQARIVQDPLDILWISQGPHGFVGVPGVREKLDSIKGVVISNDRSDETLASL